MYRSLYGHMLSFQLGKCLGVEWLDHIESIQLIFKEIAKLFFKVIVPFYIPTGND